MAIGAHLAFFSRLRVQPRDYAPQPGDDPAIAGVLAGVASLANPFKAFTDSCLVDWPSGGFTRDWSALSHDFWHSLGDYTLAEGEASERDTDVVVG
jgi:hypothetical protein